MVGDVSYSREDFWENKLHRACAVPTLSRRLALYPSSNAARGSDNGLAIGGNQLGRVREIVTRWVDHHEGRTGIGELFDPSENVIRFRGNGGALPPFDLDVEQGTIAPFGRSELAQVLHRPGEIARCLQRRRPRRLRHLGCDEERRPAVPMPGG